jgi:hypothetical protein
MNDTTIKAALKALGDGLTGGAVVELLIVGGAAGLLTGELKSSRVTGDVDASHVLPPEAWDQLQDAAAKVSVKQGLPANWLNLEDAGWHREGLPVNWRERRKDVGRFGPLQVWAVGRLDLIAMKFYAHRPQDLEDLKAMNVADEERQFVLQCLDDLENSAVADKGKIEMARNYVKNWTQT